MPDSDTETEYYTIELEDISKNIMTDEEKEYLGTHHAIQLLVPFDGSNTKEIFEFVEKTDNAFKVIDPNQKDIFLIAVKAKLERSLRALHN